MAYLARRPSGAVQIRESIRTPDGPRSRTLVTFTRTLDDSVLDQAERRATRPIDRADLIERARAMGIDWQSSAARAARRLVHGLRHGGAIQPAVKRLLLSELGEAEPAPLERGEFEEAAEWIGASPEERAASLRGLLRLGDAIVQSRGSVRVLPPASFPPFSSAGSGRRSDSRGDAEPGSRAGEVSG